MLLYSKTLYNKAIQAIFALFARFKTLPFVTILIPLQADPATGDFMVGPSAEQEAWFIVSSTPGDFREFPLIGLALQKRLRKRVGKSSQLFIENPKRFKRDVKVALTADGLDLDDIIVTEDLSDFKITIDDE